MAGPTVGSHSADTVDDIVNMDDAQATIGAYDQGATEHTLDGLSATIPSLVRAEYEAGIGYNSLQV